MGDRKMHTMKKRRRQGGAGGANHYGVDAAGMGSTGRKRLRKSLCCTGLRQLGHILQRINGKMNFHRLNEN